MLQCHQWAGSLNLDWPVPKTLVVHLLSHVQLCDLMDCSTPGFPVLHCLLEFAQTHVHLGGDAIQPSRCTVFFCPQSFPASGSFQLSCIRWPSIGASALASLLPMNIQGWFPIGRVIKSKVGRIMFSSLRNLKIVSLILIVTNLG